MGHMARTVHSIHAAKTHLSRLVERACAGEEVVIARGKTPVVKLVPARADVPIRKFGAMKGRARVSRSFFEPLPEQELSAWGE
jgi:antitoxin (DNA-binding transcriptional repressor) of toxin-antitoxin stability system